MKKIFIIAALLCCISGRAKSADFISIDTVYLFSPGTGQSAGQDSAYFPKNIFDTPAVHADSIAPASAQEDLLSLGMGGEIIVGFKNFSLIDGEGDDFFIFENVMYNLLANKYFVEPVKVAVSKNGVDWYEFPFDSLTLKGCAGTHPTYKDITGDGFTNRGGDGFNLENTGMDEINYIKITDISSIVKNNKQHPFYDATISGFDLDAVIAVHFKNKVSHCIAENTQVATKAMLYTYFIQNIASENAVYSVFDLNGNRTAYGSFGEMKNYFDNCSKGAYFVSAKTKSEIEIWKILKP